MDAVSTDQILHSADTHIFVTNYRFQDLLTQTCMVAVCRVYTFEQLRTIAKYLLRAGPWRLCDPIW